MSTNTKTVPKLKKLDHWIADTDGYRIKIMRSDEEFRETCRTPGWCYYITISEKVAGSKFEQLWLEAGKESTLSFPVYKYYETPIASLDWHGGVTYYEKFGHTDKDRAVQFGCDYNHYWDQDRDYSLEDVYADALTTLDQIKDWIARP